MPREQDESSTTDAPWEESHWQHEDWGAAQHEAADTIAAEGPEAPDPQQAPQWDAAYHEAQTVLDDLALAQREAVVQGQEPGAQRAGGGRA